MTLAPTTGQDLASRRRWSILAVIAIAQLMVVLDNTIVNIALPSAQADLGFADPQRQWVITAYALAFGSLLLLGGRMSDLFGRKRAFMVGLIGFAVASMVGGAANGFEMLVISRAAQGAFGALLAPAALSLLTTTFPGGRDRARAFGVFSAIAGSGAALGLLLGGTLTEYVDWRWCMYVNAVFAVAAFVGAAILLPAFPKRERPHLDILGTVAGSAGLFCIVYGFATAETDGWSSATVLGFLIGGVALLVAFVLLQRKVRAPLLPLRVVLDRNRGGAYLAILVLASGMFAVSLFLTYYLQESLHFSPVLTGVAFLPMVAAIVTASTTVPATLLPRVGPKPLIFAGLLVGAGALFWLSQIDSASTYASGVVGPLILMGLGLGTAMSTSINTATLGVDPGDAGVASASVNTMQQVGGSVGTALLSSIAGTAAAAYLAANPGQPGVAAEATVHSYTAAFLAASVLFLVGAVVAGAIVRPGRPHAARPVVSTTGTPDDVAAQGAEETAGTDRALGGATSAPGIEGVVRDDLDSPLSLAVLTLVTSAGAQADRTVTDDDGRYRLSADRPGAYLLLTVAPGHRPVAEHVLLHEDAVLRRDLTVGIDLRARA
jgi:EmrB/QacA subfamily drug resistance transporter